MALALVSVAPLVSMRRSLFSSPYDLKSIDKTIPNLVMCRKRMSGRPSIRVSSTASVSNDDGVRRRVGDYRYNHWDEDLIDSLATSYEAPSYLERADTLVEAIKDRFNSMGVDDGERMSPLTDLYQRLWMVDSVERLGIDRHFQNEIKSALDYVFSYWKEKGIGRGRQSAVTDLNSTALGFRTLRLHGYPVSSDVLENFKDHNGQFTCSGIQTEGEIRGVLNLFRASLIAFPGEKVMQEAEIFSTMYLKQALPKIAVPSLSQEIEYLLEYGWHTNPPRLEARMYMEVFPQDTIYEQKLVELAKVEYNIFHSLQKRELQSLCRWWKHYGFPQLSFTRHIHVEYYTFASCISTDPKQSAFRLCFAKMSYFVTVLDDIYDTYGTMEELELFTAAIKRWDPSLVDCLPEYMKGVYMAVYDTVNEMAKEAEKVQGRDTLNYVRQAWELYIDAYMPEAKWISSGYLPTFQEYLDSSKISFGTRITILQPILTLGEPLPHEILQEIDFPAKFNDLISVILRLKGDTRCYKADRARGEEASSVSCYMKDNAGLTEEDAIHCINDMVNNLLKELNWELLKPDSNVPISCRKAAFDICRIFHHGYKYRDGYGDATVEVKNLVKRTVLEPVPL